YAFHCVRRYGRGQVLGSVTGTSPLHAGGAFHVGSPEASAVLPLHRDPAPEEALRYEGLLAVATRDAAGVDPVVPLHGAPGEHLLVTAQAVPVSGYLHESGTGTLQGSFAIP